MPSTTPWRGCKKYKRSIAPVSMKPPLNGSLETQTEKDVRSNISTNILHSLDIIKHVCHNSEEPT